jgi:limonene-1,2-epoxide hydrolase
VRYDRARVSLERHATYIVATFIAGAARQATQPARNITPERAVCPRSKVNLRGSEEAVGVAEEKVVLEFIEHCDGREQDVDALTALMTDDIVWQINVPTFKPRVGRDVAREELARQNAISTGGLGGSQVLNIASNDRVVFTERVGVFETMGKRVTLHVTAVYEVENGKIAAWREYYDSVALAKQLGIEPHLVVEDDA